MRSEFEIRQAAKRAEDAKALLESPLLTECFARLKQTYVDQLLQTNVTEAAFRDKCWMAARVVDVVKDHLVTVLNDGAVARSDIETLRQEGERKKRFGIV